MSDELKACPNCQSPYGYFMSEASYACPECSHEWNPNEKEEVVEFKVLDSNGNELSDGDSVIVIKNLPVKGSSILIKAGTKIKKIRLVEADHNIDCKIDGFGSMGLKSEFVRKA